MCKVNINFCTNKILCIFLYLSGKKKYLCPIIPENNYLQSIMKQITYLFGLAVMLFYALPIKAQMMINEIMQSNIDCVMDDINEYPDSWVEIYNAGANAVNISDYKIGITEDANTAWALPSMIVGTKQKALIYCDKEAKKMHTDFRLESGNECSVYLFKGSEVVDKLTDLPKQPSPNIAYGRKNDGADEWGYMTTPTPGQKNCGEIALGVLGDPVFSIPGSVRAYSATMSLTLSLPDDAPKGTEIRVTYDGTEPTSASTLVTGPITFSNNRIVRAKLFCKGYVSPRSVTQSYLFLHRDVTLPVVSIVTDGKFLNDNKIGIYVDGSYSSSKKNYEYNWRRPINFEYFGAADEESIINQLCETRVQGGASRGSKMKSLALYAHKRFGKKNFKHEFFADQKPGINKFKSIILRNAGNDFDYLYMRDAVIQRTMAQNCDLDWQAWSPAIVFINGVYNGMLNVRERSNEDNIEANYDGLEDIDMIENWNSLKAGEMDGWKAFTEFYNEHGHTMAEYEEQMDCIEFINLMAMNLYYNNQDFPGNNIVMWRPREEGGRWRFVAKDTDFGLGLYNTSYDYKSIEWIYYNDYDPDRKWANGYEHTRLFRRLMEDEDFSREFIDRCAIYMGDFMNNKGTREVWDPMYEQIKFEYPHHRELVNKWWPNYSDELYNARNWCGMRAGSFYKQLASYYKLGTPTPLVVNSSANMLDLGKVEILMNGVPLTKGKFDGKFFAGRKLTLEGRPVDSKQVTGWSVYVSDGKTSSIQLIKGSTYTFAMPECTSMSIQAQFADYVDGMDEIAETRAWQMRQLSNCVILSNVASGALVTLYTMSGIPVNSFTADGGELRIDVERGRPYVLRVGAEAVKVIAK